MNNWDMSFFKKIRLPKAETRYIQLRWEMYNAFNHPQFNGVNNTAQFDQTGKLINVPTSLGGTGGRFGFGAVNSVRAARSMQLAAKLYF